MLSLQQVFLDPSPTDMFADARMHSNLWPLIGAKTMNPEGVCRERRHLELLDGPCVHLGGAIVDDLDGQRAIQGVAQHLQHMQGHLNSVLRGSRVVHAGVDSQLHDMQVPCREDIQRGVLPERLLEAMEAWRQALPGRPP